MISLTFNKFLRPTVLCLATSFIATQALADGPVAPRPQSPHWDHINVLDFGRGVKYMPAQFNATANDWFASHVDVAESPISESKARNATMKSFDYGLDLTICQHQSCGYSLPPNPDLASIPEAFFLHFSEDTTLTFKSQSGTTTTVNIPGCPASVPLNAACRFQTYIWDDARLVFYPKNAGFQAWMAARLVPANDGLFLDEHVPGVAYTSQTTLISGGGIREYNGARRQYGTDPVNALYNHDVAAWLTYLSAYLKNRGKFLMINVADYAVQPMAQEQVLAANGMHPENVNRPDAWGYWGYQSYIDLVNSVTTAGGTVDLVGSFCYFGPGGYTPGNYTLAVIRYRMWQLANYYLLKEPTGSPGKAYFNPTFCIDYGGSHPLAFITQWLPAYQVDVGQPVGKASMIAQSDVGAGYGVFARDYSRMLVLVRPQDRWDATDYGDATAVKVTLAEPMQMLQSDGTLSATLTSVQLRNAEAVILFKVNGPGSVPAPVISRPGSSSGTSAAPAVTPPALLSATSTVAPTVSSTPTSPPQNEPAPSTRQNWWRFFFGKEK
jgi:hypothetical protein